MIQRVNFVPIARTSQNLVPRIEFMMEIEDRSQYDYRDDDVAECL